MLLYQLCTLYHYSIRSTRWFNHHHSNHLSQSRVVDVYSVLYRLLFHRRYTNKKANIFKGLQCLLLLYFFWIIYDLISLIKYSYLFKIFLNTESTDKVVFVSLRVVFVCVCVCSPCRPGPDFRRSQFSRTSLVADLGPSPFSFVCFKSAVCLSLRLLATKRFYDAKKQFGL